MATYCTCVKCGVRFDRDKIPFVKVNNRRYAHQSCMTDSETSNKEMADYLELEKYIKELFNIKVLSNKIIKSIYDYKDNYGYSYSGILKTLKWFYEVKKNSINKSNGGIGIVPFVYKEAEEYYYNIYLNEKQIEQAMAEYAPKKREVFVSIEKVPKRRIKLMFEEDDDD